MADPKSTRKGLGWTRARALRSPAMRPVTPIIVLVAVLAACSTTPPPDASPAEVYDLVCASCHGAELEGGIGPPLGPGSVSANRSDEFLITTITRGRGRMPSFRSTLSDEQVEALVSYIRERQRQ